jgi:hypothetical protein
VATAEDPVQDDLDAIAQSRQAARQNDDNTVDDRLSSRRNNRDTKDTTSASVILARRAAATCGWLRNEGEGDRAVRLARRTVQRLSNLGESSNEDRVERLYWEAWLQGEYLGHRGQALRLLNEALRRAPTDARLIAEQSRWAKAVDAFGAAD